MRNIILLFFFIFIRLNSFAQMQKIFNTEHVDSSYFGAYVSISGNYALIGNKYFTYPTTRRRHIANIFRKENRKWKESQSFLSRVFALHNGDPFNIGVISGDKIITEDSFWHYENYFQLLKRKDGKYFVADSILIDTSLTHYSNIQKTIYKDWLMVKTFHYHYFPTILYYVDYFYRYENNKWIKKDTFYDIENIHPAAKSTRCIMKDDFVIYASSRNLYIIKRTGEKWDLFQKIPLKNVSFASTTDVSLSPNQKWLAVGKSFLVREDTIYKWNNFLYIYKLIDSTWQKVQSIELQNKEDSLFFGSFINISNNELLVGSPGRYKDNGVIYYYKLINGVWIFKLEIHPPVTDTTYQHFGYSIDRHGETVITGAPKDTTYSNAPGAAYIFQIPARDTFAITICEGDSYVFGDSIIYTEGSYKDTSLASYGVDSVVQLYVSVLPKDYSELDTVICLGDSIIIGDSIFTSIGSHEIVLKNINGCDSIVLLNISNFNLKLDTVETIANYNCETGEIKLMLNSQNKPYAFHWSNGFNGNPISNLPSGVYVVTITDKNNCNYVKEFYVPDSILYLIPNAFFSSGTKNDINSTFKIYKGRNVDLISIEIFNRWGERVFQSLENNNWDGTYRGKQQSPGVYFYKIVFDTPCGIIQETGQVMLLR